MIAIVTMRTMSTQQIADHLAAEDLDTLLSLSSYLDGMPRNDGDKQILCAIVSELGKRLRLAEKGAIPCP